MCMLPERAGGPARGGRRRPRGGQVQPAVWASGALLGFTSAVHLMTGCLLGWSSVPRLAPKASFQFYWLPAWVEARGWERCWSASLSPKAQHRHQVERFELEMCGLGTWADLRSRLAPTYGKIWETGKEKGRESVSAPKECRSSISGETCPPVSALS